MITCLFTRNQAYSPAVMVNSNENNPKKTNIREKNIMTAFSAGSFQIQPLAPATNPIVPIRNKTN